MLASPPPPFVLRLKGQFDGIGDYFSILAQDVEYVELAGGFTVGGMMLTAASDAARMTERWARLADMYSGPALVLRSTDSGEWHDARPQDLHIVIANQLSFCAGLDWTS